VIDKDRSPKWSPPRIEDVTPEMIAPYFASLGKDELVFDESDTNRKLLT
jgi:enoyl-CoA hydratase